MIKTFKVGTLRVTLREATEDDDGMVSFVDESRTDDNAIYMSLKQFVIYIDWLQTAKPGDRLEM